MTLGLPLLYDSPPRRGESDPSPGGLLTFPPSPSWARHPLFAEDREGLLCGWDVAAQRGRGRSQVFFGYVHNKNVFKHPFGHYYYRGALYSKDEYHRFFFVFFVVVFFVFFFVETIFFGVRKGFY